MKQEEKTIIRYHRSYRKLMGSVQLFCIQFFLCVIPLSAITLFWYPQITHAVCLIAEAILSPYFFADTVRIVEIQYIEGFGNVSFLSLPGQFPTAFFSMINALICLLLLTILPRIETAKPLIIFMIMLAFVHFLSSLFFLISPSLFPYDATDYSQLYMAQQIGIWFFVPLVMGIAVMPLPSSLTSKCFTMVITYLYSLLFGTVRYAIFIFILAKVSLLYMPILFFALGPLIDFVYIVGIYSIYVTRLANKISGEFTLWKWQY